MYLHSAYRVVGKVAGKSGVRLATFAFFLSWFYIVDGKKIAYQESFLWMHPSEKSMYYLFQQFFFSEPAEKPE